MSVPCGAAPHNGAWMLALSREDVKLPVLLGPKAEISLLSFIWQNRQLFEGKKMDSSFSMLLKWALGQQAMLMWLFTSWAFPLCWPLCNQRWEYLLWLYPVGHSLDNLQGSWLILHASVWLKDLSPDMKPRMGHRKLWKDRGGVIACVREDQH